MYIGSLQDIPAALTKGLEDDGLLLAEAELSAAFFDLRSGLAGELFQRFVNYRVPLALVVQDPFARGKRFGELANEHRNHPMVRILPDQDEASAWLAAARRDA